MNDEIKDQLPILNSHENDGLESIARVKYFTPDTINVWYGSEFDGEDRFYGLMVGVSVELGYFSLSELESTRGPLGLPIERDLSYEPHKTLRELMRWHRYGT
ncbi:hypothetical protein A2630_04165 [Candidatus Woesebacteria bacterium RIFCSPHIGHO2_01_FULL_44_10]|uniref:DUF2958 domain-containing protein n=1 Tax=Candidatus Woesebacteria bacterium RIFCSPLOWO2_01_FULL_44_14 TaxID=1802525 RepID=A0A1F8C1V7_9BACT|nr:MAG: hypothetical protein A2630_04165 [Candidatus Woesebacteria bacterium RIFCSPHIGHO2_01_FULL_44_10]OGM55477.1 MAG: hypothetical protein A3F62_00530 [Candidatus Woesebacteria bacterium RIFCSPHIGHO2_12_FULL_44_11]OGM70351.1 MAG: hypothetical protein A2975_03580 [Candidatus Woesebacteria bacterium RIFCSPLOWO2_01_FULL_44_14]